MPTDHYNFKCGIRTRLKSASAKHSTQFINLRLLLHTRRLNVYSLGTTVWLVGLYRGRGVGGGREVVACGHSVVQWSHTVRPGE